MFLAALGAPLEGLDDEDMRLVHNVALARQTGWTLDYVESMDPLVRDKTASAWDALDRGAAEHQRRQAKGKR